MLRIVSTKQLVDSMKLAKETGTLESLCDGLLQLDELFGHDASVVELCADLPTSPGSIAWYVYANRHGEPYGNAHYNGGLIFHRDAKEWSLHS